MDELKLRLEYLEHVTQDAEGKDSLLEQVGAIGDTLDSMLDVRKHEVQRMATEFNKQGVFPNAQDPLQASPTGQEPLSHDRSATEPEIDAEARTMAGSGPQLRSAPAATPDEVKQMMIASRFNDLSRLATELEAQLPLEMAEIKPPPNPQALIEKASELGREFDELTARSTELTKKLMEQLAKENEAVATADA